MDTSIEKEAWPVGTKLQQTDREGVHYATVVARFFVKSTGGNIVPIYITQYAWDDRTEEVGDNGYVYGAAFDAIQLADTCFEPLKEAE